MQPSLFTLAGEAFPSYFVLLVFGFSLATLLGVLWARRIGQNPDVIVDLGLAMLLAGVVGARILHVLADGYFWDYVHLCTEPSRVAWEISRAECLRAHPPDFLGEMLGASGRALGTWDENAGVCRPIERDCFAWARFWTGGLTYYGGFLGASAAAVWILRRDRFPFWKAADMAGMVIPIGLALGRLGCALGGCCFGSPTAPPWGLSFPAWSPASSAQTRLGLLPGEHVPSLPVHPTQLYESAGALLLGAALTFWLHPRKRYDGQVFLGFLAGYAALRFALEFLRADDRGGLWGLSTSQWIGLLLLAGSAALARKLRTRPPDLIL